MLTDKFTQFSSTICQHHIEKRTLLKWNQLWALLLMPLGLVSSSTWVYVNKVQVCPGSHLTHLTTRTPWFLDILNFDWHHRINPKKIQPNLQKMSIRLCSHCCVVFTVHHHFHFLLHFLCLLLLFSPTWAKEMFSKIKLWRRQTSITEVTWLSGS